MLLLFCLAAPTRAGGVDLHHVLRGGRASRTGVADSMPAISGVQAPASHGGHRNLEHDFLSATRWAEVNPAVRIHHSPMVRFCRHLGADPRKGGPAKSGRSPYWMVNTRLARVTAGGWVDALLCRSIVRPELAVMCKQRIDDPGLVGQRRGCNVLGSANDPSGTVDQHRSQVCISAFTRSEQARLVASGVLPSPGAEVLGVADAGHHRCGAQQPYCAL